MSDTTSSNSAYLPELGLLVWVFRIWGLELKPASQRPILCKLWHSFVVLMLVLSKVSVIPYGLRLFQKFMDDWLFSQKCIIIACILFGVTVSAIYIRLRFTIGDVRHFLILLSKAVTDERHPVASAELRKVIRRWTTVNVALILFFTTTFCCFLIAGNTVAEMTQWLEATTLEKVCIMAVNMGVCFETTFAIIIDTLPMMISHLLVKMFNATIQEAKRSCEKESQGRRHQVALDRFLKRHQLLSDLAADANARFSEVILWFIGTRVTIFILYAYLLATDAVLHESWWTLPCMSFVVYHSVFVTLMVVCVSKANDKIISSLLTPPAPFNSYQGLEFTEAHQQYHLYLTKASMTNTAITFGGVAPVRKSFLFTIGGTVVTYYLILKQIKSESSIP